MRNKSTLSEFTHISPLGEQVDSHSNSSICDNDSFGSNRLINKSKNEKNLKENPNDSFRSDKNKPFSPQTFIAKFGTHRSYSPSRLADGLRIRPKMGTLYGNIKEGQANKQAFINPVFTAEENLKNSQENQKGESTIHKIIAENYEEGRTSFISEPRKKEGASINGIGGASSTSSADGALTPGQGFADVFEEEFDPEKFLSGLYTNQASHI